MLTIGLTGGIGSGKSAVSDLFDDLGICVVDADVAARVVVEPRKPALSAIKERFGEAVILEDGNLDRSLLREKVFDAPEQRKWLESLLHPLINEQIKLELGNAASLYAILVSPLLFETGQHKMTNRTLVVDVPEDLQIARASTRDDTDKEQIKKIIASQMSRQERLDLADDVILNDGELEELQSKVSALHTKYLDLAKTHEN